MPDLDNLFCYLPFPEIGCNRLETMTTPDLGILLSLNNMEEIYFLGYRLRYGRKTGDHFYNI